MNTTWFWQISFFCAPKIVDMALYKFEYNGGKLDYYYCNK